MERAWCTSFPATLLSATDHVTPTRASVPYVTWQVNMHTAGKGELITPAPENEEDEA